MITIIGVVVGYLLFIVGMLVTMEFHHLRESENYNDSHTFIVTLYKWTLTKKYLKDIKW